MLGNLIVKMAARRHAEPVICVRIRAWPTPDLRI
jgi:hypothetical protein